MTRRGDVRGTEGSSSPGTIGARPSDSTNRQSPRFQSRTNRSVDKVTCYRRALLAAAAALLLSGCGIFGHSGEVSGKVLSAPTCPVERVGEECPPRPVSGAEVVALDGNAIRGSTLTDSSGAFHLTLPDGRYAIRATNVGGYASTATEQVVISDAPVSVTLIVDSGIR